LYNKSSKRDFFDLKKETIKYCLNDAILTQKFLKNIIAIIEKESKKILKTSYSAASVSHKLFYKK
jgi:hypothetical protein